MTANYTRILVFTLFAAAGCPTLAQPPPYTDMTRLSSYVPDVKVIADQIRWLSQLPFHAPTRGLFALCYGMFLDVGIEPKDFLITPQAKRNLRSLSGIGGVLSAT